MLYPQKDDRVMNIDSVTSLNPMYVHRCKKTVVRTVYDNSKGCEVKVGMNQGSALSTVIRDCHTHPFNGPFSRTTQVSLYQKGKTNLDFTEARDSEWQWHQLEHMQVCTSLQTDNHANTPPLSFLQAGCPSCRPANSVKALKDCED